MFWKQITQKYLYRAVIFWRNLVHKFNSYLIQNLLSHYANKLVNLVLGEYPKECFCNQNKCINTICVANVSTVSVNGGSAYSYKHALNCSSYIGAVSTFLLQTERSGTPMYVPEVSTPSYNVCLSSGRIVSSPISNKSLTCAMISVPLAPATHYIVRPHCSV